MGVSMTKPDQTSSELEGGRLVDKGRDDGEKSSGNLNRANKQMLNQKEPSVLSKSPRENTQNVQTLSSVEDDSLDDCEWNNVYHRLKPSKSNDLHIANTRFTGNPPTQSTSGPVFTSRVTQRDPHINSASISPQSVSFEPEMSRINQANTSGDFDPTKAPPGDRPSAPMPPQLIDDTENEAGQLDTASGYTGSTGNHVTEQDTYKVPHQRVVEVPLNPMSRRDTRRGLVSTLLNVPGDMRGVHSPVPGQIDDTDMDIDPFEGMDIPRERVSSMGSSSIYSVKEISDRLYQEYFYEVRKSIRNYGFFEKFPTPTVVSDAQRTYRQMEIPTPVDEDGNILPHPPRITKEEVFASQSQSFTEIDNRIINAPEKIVNCRETAEVVNYLCMGLDDDLSKIRAISTWMAICQMRMLESGPDKPVTPEDWCKKYRAMCRYSRIKTKLVKGVVRGYSYIPGEDPSVQRAVWISVLVNNTWWLVDPVIHKNGQETPAFSTLQSQSGTSNEQPSLFRHAESFFWNPEHFIFTHYPDEEYWQLLARPVSKDEFPELAVLSRGFFALRMKLISPTKSVVTLRRDEFNISVGYPDNSIRQFKCKLYLCDGDVLVESALVANKTKVNLRRCVFLEIRLDKHRMNATIKFPMMGSYMFELFGCSESHPWQKLCSYRLVNETACVCTPFPVSTREEWGPGYDTLRLGLQPISHKSGEIVVGDGVVQVAFKDPKGYQFRYDFLTDNGRVVGKSDTVRISVLRDKESDIVFVIDINEKLPATYILQLYAKTSNNKPFQNFCNYYVRKVECEKKPVLPRYQFSHVTVEEKPRVIQAPESGQLQLELDASGFSQLVVDLKLHDRQELNFSEHARHWIEDDQGFVELNFPRKGDYSVKVLGRNVATNHFQTLREERIEVGVPSVKWSSFPKTESNWSSYYKIEQPVAHHLQEKEYVQFSVAIREAQDVAVLAPNGWYHLVRQDDETWEGQIWTGPKSTKCRLLARFEIGSEKFTDLLWFKVMAEDDFESMEERQENLRDQALKQTHKQYI